MVLPFYWYVPDMFAIATHAMESLMLAYIKRSSTGRWDNDAKQQHAATTDQVHNNNRKQEDKRPQDVMQKRRMLGEVAIEDNAKDR